ncbi:MAG: Conserved cytoplasmic membrane protein, CmpX protein [Candidatus Uhrbacteria bacterium GW2011_GWA2_41_10]|nr:MAG: Conserved cytoplasmic membrane protein, CmpX protein [Candidatus Uhrbacteria bacterium GW2011_GWA2_41_10]
MATFSYDRAPAYTDMIRESVLTFSQTIFQFLPQFFGAAVVFFLGIFFAWVLRRVIIKMIALLKIDDLAKKFELAQTLQRAGFHLHIGHLFGWIVQWFVLIVALIAATDILGWDQVTDYLKQVVLYIPNVLIAIIILLAGILLANFVERVVHSAVQAAHFASAHFLSHAARWAILVFTFMAFLPDWLRWLLWPEDLPLVLEEGNKLPDFLNAFKKIFRQMDDKSYVIVFQDIRTISNMGGDSRTFDLDNIFSCVFSFIFCSDCRDCFCDCF